jgi:hypothetical protein
MSDSGTQPKAISNQRQPGLIFNWRLRVLWLARRSAVALLPISLLAGIALAQSQSMSPPAPQQEAQPQPKAQPKPQPKTLPLKTVVNIADAARKAKSEQEGAAPKKVYTDDDVAALPPGGISIGGLAVPEPSATSSKAKQADDTAKLAAYWKARFTAARQKLAQDKKALPSLQTQFEIERVQQDLVDEECCQLNSDRYMDLLHQIDSMKLAIKNDQQALSDLHDEFRHAGGLPGWIR